MRPDADAQPLPSARARATARAGRALRAVLCGLGWALAVSHAPAAEPTARTAPATAASTLLNLKLPDVVVQDQSGRSMRFVSDLVQGQTVLVNFIFTSCTTICSPLTAIMKGAQEEIARRGQGKVRIISVSVDPLNDSPQTLREYAKRFNIDGDWRFVTGSRQSIDAVLAAFNLPSGGNLDDHTPMVFVGRAQGPWTRAYGLAGPAAIVERVLTLPAAGTTPTVTKAAAATDQPGGALSPQAMAGIRAAAAQQAAGARATQAGSGSRGADYFTNLPLLTHQGRTVRFYDDLIKDRVVLVHSFFSSCKDVCSPVAHNIAMAQELLAQDRPRALARQRAPALGIISISVDPVTDTPELLSAYATRHGAGSGWTFVTGKKENVDWVLHKLGLYEPVKEEHSVALWVGNDRTGTWLKLHALAPPEAIAQAVRKLL